MVIWFIEIKSFDAEVLNLYWWRTLCSYKLTNESILCFIKVFCVSQLLETFFFFSYLLWNSNPSGEENQSDVSHTDYFLKQSHNYPEQTTKYQSTDSSWTVAEVNLFNDPSRWLTNKPE